MTSSAAKDFFTLVYSKNLWGNAESKSGHGSDSAATASLVHELRPLLDRHNIKSVLDCPCGDWSWMQHVNLDGINYIGGDVVDDLIERNRRRFSKSGVKFIYLDVTEDILPSVDLILVRDCWIHFSMKNIGLSLVNIERSRIPYILTTHHTNINQLHVDGTPLFQPSNRDLSGEHATQIGFDFAFRPLCLQAPPFSFPAPDDLIMEAPYFWEGHKSLALWKLADVPHNW